MKLFQSNRRALLVLALGTAGGAAGLFFLAPQLIAYFLSAAVLVGLVWVGSHHLVKLLQRRKQRRFDAGVAAREGIEDRKREWASWTAELEQQGIDRYDLPFFLLVGEPQSGKSVLLQNSDLTFPFGQTRLSGIGGTRGCDWWFTEEAVILDLAGRLFTHEGGASDEAEWEAFLGLLAGYRPICPANGVMLVIPCDSLLSDGRDEVVRKASRIQNGLLTLTNQLQAQLPIYVVLTKGDRIFGFAETVHRLETEQRHQMFGWSRPAEDYDAPFDIVEVRRAFDAVVGRARTLRDSMLSTLRLPEGLGEADRMYAFPEELAAIAPNLEVYLKRVFSESKLVDRLYFRGFYLTSGLQTGTPIANVCAELFGGAGEADKRDLSALFTRQQAYFIKDLVRRRVFSERGLVRPTQARVARSRRNAWVGYGVAAALALVSVVWSVAYVLGEHQQSDVARFRRAMLLSAQVANEGPTGIERTLAALDATFDAWGVQQRSLEEAGGIGRRESFEALYCSLCDARLAPELERLAAERLGQLAGRDPADHAEFRRRAEQVRILLSGFDPADPAQRVALADLADEELRPRLVAALERRVDRFAASTPVRRAVRAGRIGDELDRAARWVDGLWSRTLTGGDPLQIGGAAGYLVAWQAVATEHRALEGLDPARADLAGFEAQAAAYHRAADYLGSPRAREGLPEVGLQRSLRRRDVDAQLDALAELRAAFVSARTGAVPGPWDERARLAGFADGVFGARGGLPADVSSAADALEGPRVTVPTAELEVLIRAPLVAACAPATLAADAVGSGDLHERIRAAWAAAASDTAGLAPRVVQARCLVLQREHRARFADWPALAAALGGAGPDGGPPGAALATGIGHLAGLLAVLPELDPGRRGLFQDWEGRAASQLRVAVEAAERAGVERSPVPEPGSAADAGREPQLLRALVAARALGGAFAGPADRAIQARLDAAQADLGERWGSEAPDAANTAAMLRALAAYVGRVRDSLGDEEARRLLVRWLDDSVRREVERRLRWHLDLVTKVSDLPVDVEDLAATAAAVGERIAQPSDLKKWQDGLTAEWGVLDAAGLPRVAELFRGWTSLDEGIDRLRAVSTREREFGSYLTRPDARAEVLKRGLQVLRSLPPTGDGPRVAAALDGLRKAWPKGAPASVADHYLDELFALVDRRAVGRLRRTYEAELREVLERRSWLQLALRAQPADLGTIADQRRNIADELQALLGPGGELDALHRSYRLDAGLEFRPGAEVAEPGAAWAFDRFLGELRTLVRPDPAAKSIDETPLELWLAPVEPSRGIWAFNYLLTNFPAGAGDFLDTADPAAPREIGPKPWIFDARNSDGLSLRWSDSPRVAQPDDARLEVRSCLAPLLIAWLFGQPEGEGRAWLVRAPTGGGGQKASDARFRLRFARPVPARPPYPW